jgi:hypothetical protein
MVHIGCKYTGKPQSFIDTTNGVFWQVLPTIEADASTIQSALIAKRQPPKKPLRERVNGSIDALIHRVKRTQQKVVTQQSAA